MLSQTRINVNDGIYNFQEKHVRRPYLAFESVLGEALQVCRYCILVSLITSVVMGSILKPRAKLYELLSLLVSCQVGLNCGKCDHKLTHFSKISRNYTLYVVCKHFIFFFQHSLPSFTVPPHAEGAVYPCPSVIYRMFDYTDVPEVPLLVFIVEYSHFNNSSQSSQKLYNDAKVRLVRITSVKQSNV